MFSLIIILLVSVLPDSTSQITSGSNKPGRPFCNSNVYGSCLPKIEKGAPQPESDPAPPTLPSPPPPPPYHEKSAPAPPKLPSPPPPPPPPPTLPLPFPASPSPYQPTGDFPPFQSPPQGQAQPQQIRNAPIQSLAPAPIFPNQTHPGTRKRRSILQKLSVVIGMLLSTISMVVLSLIIIFFVKRRGSQHGPNQEFNQNMDNFLLNHGSLALKRYSYSKIKKITNSLNEKLGQGGFGSVYKGVLPDGSLVAVKLLTETNGSGEEFINEVASISRTSHVNIVNLLGFCYERNKRALVYEFMPNKSLDKFISHCPLDWDTLYKIAVGVARGLEYLHRGCNTRIVHFDIKPQNILLDEDFCPKISDFGLAKLCKKKQSILSVIGTRGTVGYIAPEVFARNFGRVSHKSDVYSYGMMVLEMTGAKNVVEIRSIQSSENCFPDQVYKHVIPSETMNMDDFVCEVEEEISRKMFLIGFWCIQTMPSDRPSMSKVVEMLEGNLKSIPIPPKPILFTPRLLEQQLTASESVSVESANSIEG